jgi:hypothetical protein
VFCTGLSVFLCIFLKFLRLLLSYSLVVDSSDDRRRFLHRNSRRSELEITAGCGVAGVKFGSLILIGRFCPCLFDVNRRIWRDRNRFERDANCSALGLPWRRSRHRLRAGKYPFNPATRRSCNDLFRRLGPDVRLLSGRYARMVRGQQAAVQFDTSRWHCPPDYWRRSCPKEVADFRASLTASDVARPHTYPDRGWGCAPARPSHGHTDSRIARKRVATGERLRPSNRGTPLKSGL